MRTINVDNADYNAVSAVQTLLSIQLTEVIEALDGLGSRRRELEEKKAAIQETMESLHSLLRKMADI